jgi:hypothetical protein
MGYQSTVTKTLYSKSRRDDCRAMATNLWVGLNGRATEMKQRLTRSLKGDVKGSWR